MSFSVIFVFVYVSLSLFVCLFVLSVLLCLCYSRVTKVSSERDRLLSTLDFDNLLRHFETVQAKHSEEAKQTLLQGKTSLERL